MNTPTARRSPVPTIVASLVGVAAILATYLLLRPDDGSSSDRRRSDCVPVTVVASSEKSGLLGKLAVAYAEQDRRFDGGCADVRVVSKASGDAMESLATGWDEQRDGGPAPQVWTPASSSWISLLRQRAAVLDVPVPISSEKPSNLANSPLVLAMPKPMAEALGWPDAAIGWSDLLGLATDPSGWGAAGHPEWGAFRLGKTNPHFSTSGLNATIGAYVAATGRSSDLTEDDLADPQVLDFTKGVESSVVHYGDTTLTFLANMAEADAQGQGLSYISAVAVEEKSVFDYNQGNPTGDPDQVGKGRKPKVPLVAVYPEEGTLVSDNPYVVLETVSDEQRAGADDFLAFLREPAQQRRFTDLAFRTFDGAAGDPLTPDNGLLPDAQFTVLAAPLPAVLARALATWDTQRKRARVLLVLDVSGSMVGDTGTGQSKLELAKQTVQRSLDLFAPDDEVGLWTFSTERDGAATPYTERLPVGALAANRQRMTTTIAALAPGGGTALYATTRAAQQRQLAALDESRINAIVLLTDGRNEYPKDNDLEGLVRDLDASQLERSIRVFTIAYGEGADLDALERISTASRAAAYDARDPASIEKVFTSVLSNF
ncbi:MAG: VWA domain-containing protein [Dactylosporangium sp.]|nr:substrate-binding and VWA domain-containing protein [Dactylosporangium sp.]NNJ61785.1 VWA domain-containing protein [Dactylosporangium sp.]